MSIRLPTRCEIPAHLRANARAQVKGSEKDHEFLAIESRALSNIINTVLPQRLDDFLKSSSVPMGAFVHGSDKVARLRVNLTSVAAKCDGFSKMRFDARRFLLAHVLEKAISDYYLPEIKSLDETGDSYVTGISRDLDSHPLLPTFSP